jgi:multiple sugar transport system permease protein
VLITPALLILLALFVAPIGRAIGLSLQEDAGTTGLEWYERFFSSPSYLTDLWFTMWTAAIAVAGSVVLALPVALVLRAGGRFRGVLYVLVLVPLLVPHLIAAYALRLTFSGSGPLFALLVDHLHVLPAAPRLVNEAPGLVLALIWKFFPVMTLTLLSGLESLPDSLQEAARDLSAGWWRRLREVTIPPLTPALLAGGILVFVLAASQFSMTLVMYGGAKVTTIPLDIYFLTFGQRQQPYGSALGIVFTVVTLGLLAVVTMVVRRTTRAMLGSA